MQYFRYEGINKATEEHIDYRDRDYCRDLIAKTDTFNEGLNGRGYFFVSLVKDESCVIGIIVNDKLDVSKMVPKFLKTIDVEVVNGTLTEITYGSLDRLLHNAEMKGLIDSREDILDMFDIGDLRDLYRCGFTLDEETIMVRNKESIYKAADALLSSDSLTEELDRIYAPRKKTKAAGIPVQYMVITDDNEEREESVSALTQALIANGRVQSRRCCRFRFHPNKSFNPWLFKSWFKSCEGGLVVIRIAAGGNSESDIASGDLHNIEIICDIAKDYANKVQMIFCLPRECTKTKDMFYSNLGSTSIVEIKEDLATGAKAEKYLDRLASESGLRSDRKLHGKLTEPEGYLARDLRVIFSDWYSEKMKTVVYPQYKDIASAKTAVKKLGPKGSAFDELQNLVGLPEAKTVMKQALDYYKAQKLFADKGMPADHPAMHMVFKGNPGTAKTTVARLFARIMRENGLLSKGHLIECGRGDLVGQFVGWTAPLVKKKFSEAEGGVLFIDEAYSLVDDRSGSYGDEAINTIVQEMENHREDMIVIFAGYPDKMEEFINKNPGLRSRIAFHVPFSDYDTDSLCKIAAHIAEGKGLKLTDEAMEKLSTIFDVARNQPDFGNGRYARNIIEQARMAQASRLVAMDYDSVTRKDIATLCPEDITAPDGAKQTRKFGFCA